MAAVVAITAGCHEVQPHGKHLSTSALQQVSWSVYGCDLCLLASLRMGESLLQANTSAIRCRTANPALSNQSGVSIVMPLMDRLLERMGAACGIVYVVLVFVGGLSGLMSIARFFLVFPGFLFFLYFLESLWSGMRRGEEWRAAQ